MKKKIISTIILVTLGIALIGCSNKDDKKNENDNSQSPATNTVTSDLKDENSTSKDNSSDAPEGFEENVNSEGDRKTVSNKDVRFYFYNAVTDKIEYFNKNIPVTDGALVTAIVDTYKGNSTDEYSYLPKEALIKSAKLDKSKDLLTVNFGSVFLNPSNMGSGVESDTIKSFVNTLGYAFGVSNVYITVDGKPYSSGHIIMEEGVPFKVSYDNSVAK